MSYPKTCPICERAFEAKFPHQVRCSSDCTRVASQRRQSARDQSLTLADWRARRRLCRWCGQTFQLTDRNGNNRQYCSDDCQAAGYAQREKEFHERNPQKMAEYRKASLARTRVGGRDTVLSRLYRRYPDLPRACESCGESRVLDLAHKPEHARHGAPRVLRFYQRHVFWVLCPTCHALVDRRVCQPSDLGLS